MNSLQHFISVSFPPAVGIALLHFLWQGLIVAGLLRFTLELLKGRSAQLRYAVSLLALILMLALPFATVWYFYAATPALASTSALDSSLHAAHLDSSIAPVTAGNHFPATDPGWNVSLIPVTPWITLVWAFGVFLLSGRMLTGWLYTMRMRRRGVRPIPDSLKEHCSALLARARVSRPVLFLESAWVQVPTAIGWLKPVVLIPTSALTGLSGDQLQAILLHELAHIRRHDYLVNLFQSAVEILLFYHPAVWWVSHQIRIERENCCDDHAVHWTGNRIAYAKALVNLETLRCHPTRLAMAADGGSLVERIHRLLQLPSMKRERSGSWITGLVVFATVLTISFAMRFALSNDSAEAASDVRNTSSAFETASEFTGQWIMDLNKAGSGKDRARLTLIYGTKNSHHESSDSIHLNQLHGLTESMIQGSGSNVQFQIQRDAGTLQCEGWFRDGKGSGHFVFVASETFISELRKRGYETPSPKQSFQLALSDVSLALVDELKKQGYERPSMETLVRVGTHGVTLSYVQQIGALGYHVESVEKLIRMRDHGVTPEYIRGLKSAGYGDLSADEVVRARDHGVSLEYVSGMAEAGYGRMPMEDTIRARDHGVTPDFIRELSAAGYVNISMEEVVRTRDHGVTPEYIHQIKDLGLTSLSLKDLVRLRDHGVSPDFVKGIKEAGFSNASAEELVRMRDHGVTPEYIQRLRDRGIRDLTIEEVIRFRDRGFEG